MLLHRKPCLWEIQLLLVSDRLSFAIYFQFILLCYLMFTILFVNIENCFLFTDLVLISAFFLHSFPLLTRAMRSELLCPKLAHRCYAFCFHPSKSAGVGHIHIIHELQIWTQHVALKYSLLSMHPFENPCSTLQTTFAMCSLILKESNCSLVLSWLMLIITS